MSEAHDHGEPLGAIDDKAIVRGALGAIFHLEAIEPDDEDRLDRVNDLVWEWFGKDLDCALLSTSLDEEPVKRSTLDYIAGFPAGLEAMAMPTAEQQRLSNNVIKSSRTHASVITWGAEDSGSITPFSYRFWGEIGDVPDDDVKLPGYAVLKLTVPEDWPLDDFEARVKAIAKELRLRWAAAGLMFATFELADLESADRVEYANARRYPGYDLGTHLLRAQLFHRFIRSINWLTFLGPAMTEELDHLGKSPASSARVQVSPFEGGLLLRAGPRPERGDLNRLQVPAAYREADALVRPIRHDGERFTFPAPWDAATSSRWIRRFELQAG